MPTDLEHQVPRFAKALDREAPTISVDEILSRGTVAVDVDPLELPTWEQVPQINDVTGIGAAPTRDSNGERDTWIELVPTVATRPPARRRVAPKVALGLAVAAVLVVALAAVVQTGDEPDPADVPTSTIPVPPTTPTVVTETPTSGGMWPQSTLEEVRAAQELADAGDPDYTWQVGAQLTEDDPYQIELELVDRFLREVLGWEAYVFNGWEGGGDGDGWVDGYWTDQRFIRCAPGRTNSHYPPQPDAELPGESCAPTIDDLNYESVRIDLAQLARKDRDGIWVVNRWELTAPFAQADPVAVAAEVTERLEEYLAARLTGAGAEGQVHVSSDIEVPLLYTTTSGAPYERYEIERVDGPRWPYGRMLLSVRLFADGDATVVEQQISWDRSQSGGLWMDANTTTENGQPVVLSYTSSDSEVTVAAPSTWDAWLPGNERSGGNEDRPDVWSGGLWRSTEVFGSGERIELVDPVAYDAWCAANGGSPLLSAPADAASIAQQLIADPNFATTAPVAARVGGLEAVSIDVTLAPGGKPCGIGITDISRWIHGLWEPGLRLRLYLVDLPEGMSAQTLAITVVAPEERFSDVIAETAPIIDSIEFHPS